MATLSYAAAFDPRKVLDDPEFKILKEGEKPDPGANLAVCYNAHKQVRLVQKPRPKPGYGQVLVHVRATGICGWVYFLVFLILPLAINSGHWLTTFFCILQKRCAFLDAWMHRRIDGGERRGMGTSINASTIVIIRSSVCTSAVPGTNLLAKSSKSVRVSTSGKLVSRSPFTPRTIDRQLVGDRVAIEAGVPCMKASCDDCRTGRYNGCKDVVFFSTPPFHG